MPGRAPVRTPASREAEVHVALLRGINVGGKNRLTMARLAAMFTAAGCRPVRTYIQSGNVAFRAPAAEVPAVAARVESALAAELGSRAPLVLRTRAELAAVARRNPFLAAGADPARLHVAFLAATPAAARLAGLDPRRSPPDEVLADGREVFLHVPNGMGRTRYTNDYLDRQLGTTSTVRNWQTVLALLALAEEI